MVQSLLFQNGDTKKQLACKHVLGETTSVTAQCYRVFQAVLFKMAVLIHVLFGYVYPPGLVGGALFLVRSLFR